AGRRAWGGLRRPYADDQEPVRGAVVRTALGSDGPARDHQRVGEPREPAVPPGGQAGAAFDAFGCQCFETVRGVRRYVWSVGGAAASRSAPQGGRDDLSD